MAEEDKQDEKKSVEARQKKNKKDEVYNNKIEINPKLEEAAGSTAVVGWGRMNPITSGHEKLVNKIGEVARKNSATPLVFLTHSQDAKKNPLSYDDKVMLAKKAFGSMIQKSKSKTIIQVMQELEKKFKDVILVVGADRIKEFEALLNRYNGKDYNFDSIKVVSAGSRVDPDSDKAKEMTADSMSASVMRKLASEGDKETFKKGLPKKLVRIGDDVYDMVRAGMKLAEELEEQGLLSEVLDRQQRRQRAITMRRYKTKIANARKRSMRKAADSTKLEKRARKAAINAVRKKVAQKRGENYSQLDPAQKMLIDKKVAKRKNIIDRIAKKMLPQVRKQDRERLSAMRSKKMNEEFELFFEETTKRYHEARNKDGSIKLDGRFRAFKNKPIKESEAEQRLRVQHKKERENMTREHEKEMDAVKTRTLRRQINKINKESYLEEFDTDKDLLAFIEASANDIFESIELEEAKCIEGLQKKSIKSGIPLETILHVYENGAEQWNESYEITSQQLGYARVNAFITKSNKLDEGKKKGLWDNIHAKRKRIKAGSGEKMRKPGEEGAPTAQDFKDASEAVSPAQQAAIAIAKKKKEMKEEDPCWTGYKQVGMKMKNGEEVPNCVPEETNLDEMFEAYTAHDRWGVKKAASVTVNRKMYNHALDALKKLLDRKKKEAGGKGMRHGSGYYAAQIARSYDGVDARTLANMLDESEIFEEGHIFEEGGAGDRGTPKVTKRYKKDTPGENVNEAFEALLDEDVTQKQISDLEKFADRLLDKFGVDVEFTRHFADRMNDERNKPAISVAELQKLFKKIAKNKAKDIKQNANSEAVLKDMQADLNLPVVIKFNRDKEEFEVVNKTIMRKKNFATSNKVITY